MGEARYSLCLTLPLERAFDRSSDSKIIEGISRRDFELPGGSWADSQFAEKMSYYGKRNIPFLFVIDFLAASPAVIPVSRISPADILFDIDGKTNVKKSPKPKKAFSFRKFPIGYPEYEAAFKKVKDHEIAGNSYLVNLTFPTRIETSLSLPDIFHTARARYKLFFEDRFVVFSPEAFVRIDNGIISAFPMKGTIDASVPDAERRLLEDEKEHAEHVTIVDLLRNDLNIVGRNTRVEKFRFLSRITSNEKAILQTSSQVSAELPPDYPEKLGTIIARLLPAGSVTGAPKRKTVEIIREAEPYDRGFYTGVFGWSDGRFLESAVMIRFIENKGGGLLARSGGGITIYSDCASEYEEMIDKVYIPLS